MEQYHLKGRHMSNRAVRVKMLDPTETEENLQAAAKIVGPDGLVLDLKKTEWRMGVKRFIVSFSEPCEDPMAADVKWTKASPAVLDDMGSVFTAKDLGVLEAIFRDYHEVNPAELEAIAGKALPVSGG